MIKILLFDFDGTISDARAIARKNLFLVLDRHNYKYNKKMADKLLGVKMQLIFKGLDLPIKDIDQIRKEFYELMLKDTIKLHKCVSVKPLRELKKKFRLIVISNSESKFLLKSAKKLSVFNLFHKFYGAEMFRTKDQEIKHILKKFNIKRKEAMYIGDRFSDVDFAKKAGVLSVSIHNNCSWSGLKEVLNEKPDFIIHDFYDLKELVEKFNKIEVCAKNL